MKSRQRATLSQFLLMIEFMERHGDLGRPPLGSQGRSRVDKLWQRLAGSLNSIGAGVKKSPVKWKKVWADWKFKTKRKALMIQHYNNTGIALSALETRVLALIGKLAEKGYSQTEEHGSNIDTPPPKLAKNFDIQVELESRQRATVSQFSLMIEFMERYGDLGRPPPGPQSRLRVYRLWQRLAVILNSNGAGVKKSFVKWKRVWADWKTKTKRKAFMIRRYNNTGMDAGPGNRPSLTALETRVLALIDKMAGKGYSQNEEQESNIDTTPPKLAKKIDIQVESKSRRRATFTQFSLMIEFMERHGDLGRPPLGPQGHSRVDRLWQRLAGILNSNGAGVKRSCVKWKRVWADWKSKTKKKALMILRYNNSTGGRPGNRRPLTALETRVLALIGKLAGKGCSQTEELGSNMETPPSKLTENLDIQDEMVSSPPKVVLPLSPLTSLQFPPPSVDASTSTTQHLPIDKTEPISPLPSLTSPNQCNLSPRRRRRLPIISFKRVAIELAAIERCRLNLEEMRERNEARRIEVEHERNVLFGRFADIAEAMCRQYLQNKDQAQ